MKKTLSLVVGSSMLLNGCAAVAPLQQKVAETYASDNPCSNNSRNLGVTAGALLGAGLGAAIGKATNGDKAAILAGAALGAGAAGMLGWNVGKDIDRRRCELFKIAERYQIKLHSSPIMAEGESEPIGLTINLPEKSNGGHFRSDSDVLTPEARRYFTEIARQYSLSVQLYNLPANATGNERETLRKQLTDKKLILIGHTDDTGYSSHNADLSERRARAVATLFRENGIPESNLFYQGAGETLPIADNRTNDGRQQNRRVEIIDVNDESALRQYIASRSPNLEFYRPSQEVSMALPEKTAISPPSETTSSRKTAKQTSTVTAKPASNPIPAATSKIADSGTAVPAPQTSARQTPPQHLVHPIQNKVDGIDFGGKRLDDNNASLPLGKLIAEEGGFSLVSHAYASDMIVLQSCNRDRPRVGGTVKSLKDGRSYAVNEHIPGLYGTTWADRVNGHLVVLNRVSVLRDGAKVDALPEVKVYKDYDPVKNKNQQPTLSFTPQVNIYRGSKGLLYRMFVTNQNSVQCMDVLLPLNGGRAARNGLIVYGQPTNALVASFQPKSL